MKLYCGINSFINCSSLACVCLCIYWECWFWMRVIFDYHSVFIVNCNQLSAITAERSQTNPAESSSVNACEWIWLQPRFICLPESVFRWHLISFIYSYACMQLGALFRATAKVLDSDLTITTTTAERTHSAQHHIHTIMTGAWVLLLVLAAAAVSADDTDFNVVNEDGSFKFG